MVRQLLVVLALASLLTAASAGPAQAAAAGSATGVSPVKATDASVTGYSRLARGSGGVRFKMPTTKLQPGNAYTRLVGGLQPSCALRRRRQPQHAAVRRGRPRQSGRAGLRPAGRWRCGGWFGVSWFSGSLVGCQS
jgi:hypothetical protein